VVIPFAGVAELAPKDGQTSVQAALDGHSAHLEGCPSTPVTPPLQHHPAQHLLGAGIQEAQQGFHPRLALMGILLGVYSWAG
jgi:hypothetical protein